MFLRKITGRYGGRTFEYLCLVESYRDHGRVRQRVIANVGRADLLAPHLRKLMDYLRPYTRERFVAEGDLTADHGLTYGPVLVARHLWDQLGLQEIVACRCRPLEGMNVADAAFVLVAHRLLHPGSEHALAWWLEESYVFDSLGRRILPKWERHGRVLVSHRQLRMWYQTLDRLLEAKEAIEQDLYLQLRDLFGLQVDLVFFDITSAYFEGLARHGYSRDGHPRDRQVLIGVVMASGWPIASYVFEGNRQDRATVEEILGNVRRRFFLQRVVWVADRGMVSEQTLQVMTRGGDRYLVGLQRRRSISAQAVLQAARGPWEELPTGGGACEVHLPNDPARYVVVRSPERLRYEREMRRQSMRRQRDALRKLSEAVARGRLRAPEKIGSRAGRILKEHHGSRYFSWAISPDGQFRFWVDRMKLREELRIEGTYLLKTNDPDLGAVEAVAIYKELQAVERAFRDLKDVLDSRPIYHRTPSRVRAHMFVAHLALLLGCALQKALQRAGLSMSLDTALEALRPIRLVELEVEGRRIQLVTRPGPHGQAVLRAVGIHQLKPPRPRSDKTKTKIQENQGL